MKEKILKLKALENAIFIANGWFYDETFTREEYIEQIGEYKDLEPSEIMQLILKLIRELQVNDEDFQINVE
jgi:hypothetical protein